MLNFFFLLKILLLVTKCTFYLKKFFFLKKHGKYFKLLTFPVRGWLDREEKRKYRVGQFWYLISRDWWITWLQYVNNNNVICEYCKHTGVNQQRQSNSNCGIDEALVCDESFNTNSLDSVGVDVCITSDSCSMGKEIIIQNQKIYIFIII